MKMIKTSELAEFTCPHCGHIMKAKSDAEPLCPKCSPEFKGWSKVSDLIKNQKPLEDEDLNSYAGEIK